MKKIQAEGISQIKLIDATPIGINIRSTVATYANIHDELRKIYARAPLAKDKGFKAGDFSYNTGSLRCPTCDGTGKISLDVQFLPDVDIPCPDCRGSRCSKEAFRILRKKKGSSGAGDTIFVFDEPTIGLHPLDVITLLSVFRHLIENGATVIVIEHDLDVIRSCKESLTGRYI